MEKSLFVIITPDPSDEAKSQICRLEDFSDMFQCDEDHNGEKYQIELVWRTEKWYEKLPELG